LAALILLLYLVLLFARLDAPFGSHAHALALPLDSPYRAPRAGASGFLVPGRTGAGDAARAAMTGLAPPPLPGRLTTGMAEASGRGRAPPLADVAAGSPLLALPPPSPSRWPLDAPAAAVDARRGSAAPSSDSNSAEAA
jgi:hypothetical protein